MDLTERIRMARAGKSRKGTRIGSTPVDIEILLREEDDSECYFSQIHYAHQFDRRGYPEMRREVVDYLEASLDRPRTEHHLEAMYVPSALKAAVEWLERAHPDTYIIYAAMVLDGRSVASVAEETGIREGRILRILDQGRTAVRGSYDRYLEYAKRRVCE